MPSINNVSSSQGVTENSKSNDVSGIMKKRSSEKTATVKKSSVKVEKPLIEKDARYENLTKFKASKNTFNIFGNKVIIRNPFAKEKLAVRAGSENFYTRIGLSDKDQVSRSDFKAQIKEIRQNGSSHLTLKDYEALDNKVISSGNKTPVYIMVAREINVNPEEMAEALNSTENGQEPSAKHKEILEKAKPVFLNLMTDVSDAKRVGLTDSKVKTMLLDSTNNIRNTVRNEYKNKYPELYNQYKAEIKTLKDDIKSFFKSENMQTVKSEFIRLHEKFNHAKTPEAKAEIINQLSDNNFFKISMKFQQLKDGIPGEFPGSMYREYAKTQPPNELKARRY